MRKLGTSLLVGSLLVLLVAACSSDPKADAKSFVSAAKQDAGAAANNSTTLLTEVGLVIKGDSSTTLIEVASTAETLHGHLGDFRSMLLGAKGASGNDELDFITAENDLKSGVGAIESWAGTPNAATLAHWSSLMGTAIQEWNASVKKLWPRAGVSPVPTIATS